MIRSDAMARTETLLGGRRIARVVVKHSRTEQKDYRVCLPLVKGGQERAEREEAALAFLCHWKREWGKGGREIMQAGSKQSRIRAH